MDGLVNSGSFTRQNRLVQAINGGLSLGGRGLVVASEHLFSGSIDLKLCDDNVGGVDTEVDSGSVDLILGQFIDGNSVLGTEDVDNLSFDTLVASGEYLDFIVLLEGQ